MNIRHEPDSFDVKAGLAAIYDAVRFNKVLIASCCVITLLLVTVYVVAYPPVFRAEATLMIEREHDATRDTFYSSWAVFRKDDARTEMALMTSGGVLKDIIEKENLKFADVHHSFMDHTRYLWDVSWPGRAYKTAKRWIFPPAPGTKEPTAEEIDRGRTLEAIKKGIAIMPVAESNVGLLVVKAPSPRAANIANTLLDTYLEHRANRYYKEARTSLDVLNEEVQRAAGEVRDAARERLAFAQRHGLAFDFNKELQELQSLTTLEASISANRSKIAALQASLSQIEQQLAAEPATKTISTALQLNAIRETAKAKRLDLQMALVQYEGRYRDDSPEIQDLKADIARMDKLIAENAENIQSSSTEGLNSVQQNLIMSRNTVQTELEGARAGLTVMESTAARMKSRLAGMPALQQRMRELDTRFSAAHDIYQALLIKRAQTAVTVVTSKNGPPSMRVVDYAAPPYYKSWPKTKYLYPAGLAVGLLIGVFAAIAKTFIEGTIRKGDLESGRGVLPLYSTISIPAARPPLTLLTNQSRTALPADTALEADSR